MTNKVIAKNGDKVVILRDGSAGAIKYSREQVAIMVDKAFDLGDPTNLGGTVLLETGKYIYLYKHEYEVVTESVPTAESLRSRYLLSKQEAKAHSINIQNLEKEQEGIVAQLKEMGFSLYEALENEERISFPTIVKDVVQEIDYDDHANWKKGMLVECVNSNSWGGDFVSGGVYRIRSDFVSGRGVLMDSECGEQRINAYVSDFKFHSIGTYKCDT